MPLPESIPVRYTEEDAGYVTVRPVVRQTFRRNELLDMVLSVTGKDAARVRQVLRAGTLVYHFFRYWWTGFESDEAELRAALARFPDADSTRPFSAGECVTAVFESGDSNPRVLLELDRAVGVRRRTLRGKSFWSAMLELAADAGLTYRDYSYAYRGDTFVLKLDAERLAQMEHAARRWAPGPLKAKLGIISRTAQVMLVCPRPASTPWTAEDTRR